MSTVEDVKTILVWKDSQNEQIDYETYYGYSDINTRIHSPLFKTWISNWSEHCCLFGHYKTSLAFGEVTSFMDVVSIWPCS